MDVSNYTSDLTHGALQDLYDAGVRAVIVQAVTPPAGYPPGVTRAQCQAVVDFGGMALMGYVWLWYQDAGRVARELTLFDGYPVRQLYLDVETSVGARSVALNRADVNEGMGYLDAYLNHDHANIGIYTARYYWQQFLGDWTAYSDHPLWTAQWDLVPDASVFVPYGGWQSCQIKQFGAVNNLAGVSGLDQNVVALL